MKRKIIEIDRGLCNGCGNCTTACAEGALALDAEGKAVLVREIYCDGLGACLDVCPTGALKIVEREASSYDEEAAVVHVSETRGADAALAVHRTSAAHAAPGPHGGPHGRHGGCPGSMARSFTPASRQAAPGAASSGAGPAPAAGGSAPGAASSELGQWPIQLHLVSPAAPYFRECDLLVAADCTAFALGSFHADLLRGKSLVIACPKLDSSEGYVEKLAELIAGNTIYSVTVAIMEVPCCTGLARMVEEAVQRSGKSIAVRKVVVGLDGEYRQGPGAR
jgi:NAD-dependent dihydropyrimidine dehydrogenase PreA subunit